MCTTRFLWVLLMLTSHDVAGHCAARGCQRHGRHAVHLLLRGGHERRVSCEVVVATSNLLMPMATSDLKVGATEKTIFDSLHAVRVRTAA